MRCIYCKEEGHNISNCNKDIHLNELIFSETMPNFENFNLLQLKKIASVNNIKWNKAKPILINELKKIWQSKFNERHVLYDCIECCICLNYINENNNTVLKCGHKFHFDCILHVLNSKNACPICRKEIITQPTDDNYESIGSSDDLYNTIIFTENFFNNEHIESVPSSPTDQIIRYVSLYYKIKNNLLRCYSIILHKIFIIRKNNIFKLLIAIYGVYSIYLIISYLLLIDNYHVHISNTDYY